MKEIGSTKNFQIGVDTLKNRIHLIVSGDALKANENQDAPLLVESACAQLRPGFTCLADHTGLKLFGLPDIAGQIMSAMMRSGVRKIASVWPNESFAKLVVGTAAKETGGAYASKRQSFTDLDSAKKWLDE